MLLGYAIMCLDPGLEDKLREDNPTKKITSRHEVGEVREKKVED